MNLKESLSRRELIGITGKLAGISVLQSIGLLDAATAFASGVSHQPKSPVPPGQAILLHLAERVDVIDKRLQVLVSTFPQLAKQGYPVFCFTTGDETSTYTNCVGTPELLTNDNLDTIEYCLDQFKKEVIGPSRFGKLLLSLFVESRQPFGGMNDSLRDLIYINHEVLTINRKPRALVEMSHEFAHRTTDFRTFVKKPNGEMEIDAPFYREIYKILREGEYNHPPAPMLEWANEFERKFYLEGEPPAENDAQVRHPLARLIYAIRNFFPNEFIGVLAEQAVLTDAEYRNDKFKDLYTKVPGINEEKAEKLLQFTRERLFYGKIPRLAA